MDRTRDRGVACLVIGLATALTVIVTAGGTGTASTIPSPIGSLAPATSPPVIVVPTAGYQWITAPCARASFGDVEHDPQLGMLIDGSAMTCTPYKVDSAFAVATFRLGNDVSFVHGPQLVPYSPTGGTSLRVLVRPTTPAGSAVCLLRSSTARLACVRIVDGPGSAPGVEPIAVDDPLVDRTVVFDGSRHPLEGTLPGCANCVEAPFERPHDHGRSDL